MSRGVSENSALIKNATDQMDRLVHQLADLESNKDDLDVEDYEEMKKETRDQMIEFENFLLKMQSGDVSLVSDVNAMQLAIQAAISEAFHTPEVIGFFARKEPGNLRTRLAEIERDIKTGKLGADDGKARKAEVLAALQRLGEKLSDTESAFLAEHASEATRAFAQVTQDSTVNLVNMTSAIRKASDPPQLPAKPSKSTYKR